MADDLNSLLQANRSSSVLQGIMNPAQVNPLAALNSATQTAGGIYNIRKLQAEQVAGQLATESIDPVTKQFDPNVYNAKIAAAGPLVAMAAQAGLQNASTLSQTQLGQQHMKVGYVQGVLGALNDNSSRDQVMSALDRGVASGMLTPTDRDNMAAHVPPDPAAMPAFIQQARLANASSMDQYHAAYGTTGSQTGPNGATIGFVQKPAAQGGGISAQPQAGAPQGQSQENLNAIVQIGTNPDGSRRMGTQRQAQNLAAGRDANDDGQAAPAGTGTGGPAVVRDSNGNPVSPNNPPRLNVTPPTPAAPQGVPAPPGGTGVAVPGANYNSGVGAALGATSAAPAAALPVPPTPPAVVPPPAAVAAPPPATNAPAPIPPNAPRASLQGGVPVASATNALQPNVGAGGPPSPLVPGDVSAIMDGMNRARGAPSTGTQTAGAAPGFTVGLPTAQESALTATGTASAGRFQDIVQQGVKARSQDALLATMASEAQGYRPGPGADLAMSVKRTILGLGAQVGTTFGIDTDKLAKQESVQKIANQLADAQGAGSDARLAVSEGANPSNHNTAAGLDLIIRQLRGNADYLRVRQQMAAQYPDKSDIEGFESKVGANLDPRAFQYQRLSPQQKTDYYNGLTDKGAFRKAYDWANSNGLLP